MKKFLIVAGALLLAARLADAQDAVTQWPTPSPAPAHPHEADRVVVSTTPLGGELFEQTQPVSILSGDDLKLRLEPTIGETLNREPGVSSTYFGPGSSRPVIRGLGDDRVRVLQDGLNSIDVSNVSPDHAATIEPLTIESIEVVRGPATLLYGPNTVGGAVNVIDNRISSERLSRPIEGRTDARYSTADEGRSGAAVVEFGLGPIVVHLDGFKRRTENIEIPGFARSARLRRLQPLPPGEEEPRDELPNSFTESEGGAAGASYIWDAGYAGVSYSGIDSTYGTVAEPDVTIGLEQRRWDLRGAFRKPFEPIKSITYKFGYSDYTHTEFEGTEVGTVFQIDGYDARIETVHEKLGPFEGMFGYQTQKTDFSALGAEAFLPPVGIETPAVFLFEEIELKPVKLQFGARYDHQSTQTNPMFGPGISRDFNAFSGSAGIVYTPADAYALALSLAYSQRPPTYVELFANGPHIATNAFEFGDPNLDLEESIGVDLTFRKKLGRITGAVSVFYNRFKNFIAAEPTGEISPGEDGEEGLPIFAFHSVDADFIGGEVSVTFHLIEPVAPVEAGDAKDNKALPTPAQPGHQHRLHLEKKLDYTYAENRDAGRSLPRITPFRASTALVYEWSDRFNARVEGQYSHAQDRTAEFELPTDSYFLLNASASYRVKAGPIDFDLYLKGTNLTNEEARLHTSFLKDIAPLAGRGVLLGVRTTF